MRRPPRFHYGFVIRSGIEQMTKPANCAHCGSTYDLAKVQPISTGTHWTGWASWATWRSPCCGRIVDTRHDRFTPDYFLVDRHSGRVMV